MRRSSDGKTAIYLLFLVLGIGFGLITGGEFMRRLSSGQLNHLFGKNIQSPDTLVNPTPVPGSDSTVSENAVQENIFDTRRNAIVIATRKVAPCVVGIVVTQIQVVGNPYQSNDFFDFFFGPELMPKYREVESMGSGFIIRNDGMILTNYHVVQNAAKLYVNFSDGRRIEGKIVGVDERADLAVISVNGHGFKNVKFGNSEDVMIGEWAIAIGNPFLNFINDAHPTVTVGVVSALNRNFAPSEGVVYYQGMIQTDAAINPGNSGGPLVNAMGEVIGINTFIFTGSNSSKGSIGIGFAIPIERARRVAEELISFGKRRQVWTGISVQDLNRSIALALGYDGTDGVVIVSVQPGSPGEIAGLKTGDIIKKMGNRLIETHADIDGFFLDYFVGDNVNMTVIRKSKQMQMNLILKEYTK
ncbi:MAG TPA: trypsin-like peptidase domain-containing protein [Chitinispirillaceae bacterium]|nr:trypsin-like peptidase domain-containing protein [Chitinispirillaceae bacterium]